MKVGIWGSVWGVVRYGEDRYEGSACEGCSVTWIDNGVSYEKMFRFFAATEIRFFINFSVSSRFVHKGVAKRWIAKG